MIRHLSPIAFWRLLLALGTRCGAACALLALALGGAVPAQAQVQDSAQVQDRTPLFLVNDGTAIREVDFRFAGTQTFEADQLLLQIATQGPTFFDRVKDAIPLVLSATPHPFSPIALQKDVARLRQFYRQNGFLRPDIDYYPATTLDTAANEIRVVFAIEEGPPLIIQDVTFYAADSAGYAVSQFESRLREDWIDFRDRTAFKTGERYTDFARTRIEDDVLQWLQNKGFAFARIGAEVNVDSTYDTADIRFFVDAGPRARISSIEIDGNTSLSDALVRRELPFDVGDRFSSDDLSAGQRELFGLNLFRVALAKVPAQPRDSTVDVRYTVRESPLRYLSAQPGYARTKGLTAQGQWTHRNFLGGARQFSVDGLAETGIGEAQSGFGTSADQLTTTGRLFRASLSLRQPYLFTTKLSGIVSPFLQYEKNPFLLEAPDRPFDINAREFGLNTTLIYEILPFRTISLQHTFSRALLFAQRNTALVDSLPGDQGGDFFNKSILSLGATLGNTDDYLNPSRGFLVQPFVEFGGGPLGRGVQYYKLGSDLSAYTPLTDGISIAGRVTAGRLFPFGDSKGLTQTDTSRIEERFDPIRFYAGGGSDVRGWRERLAGDKFARAVLDDDGNTTGYVYEAAGGLSKLSLSAELRLPFPGLGESWRTAVFLDAGQVSDDLLGFDDLRYGTGAGLRYRTPVGFLRLDLAYKLNPSFQDLRDPEDVFQFNNPEQFPDAERPDERFIRRFRLHLSIGQSF